MTRLFQSIASKCYLYAQIYQNRDEFGQQSGRPLHLAKMQQAIFNLYIDQLTVVPANERRLFIDRCLQVDFFPCLLYSNMKLDNFVAKCPSRLNVKRFGRVSRSKTQSQTDSIPSRKNAPITAQNNNSVKKSRSILKPRDCTSDSLFAHHCRRQYPYSKVFNVSPFSDETGS